MATEIIMPKLGMTMEEGTVVEWLKKKGEQVKKGEPIVVISSNKIEKDVEAREDGYLIEVVAKVDETIPVGKPLGYIGELGETIDTEPPTEKKAKPMEEVVTTKEPTPGKDDRKVVTSTKRVRISPAARKLAKENNIDVNSLVGTGPNGRITRADVMRAKELAEKTTIETRSETATNRVQTVKGQPLTGIRKVIATRMLQSVQQSAQLTIMKKADVTDLMDFHSNAKALMDREQYALTITDYISCAVVKALQKHQQMNSHLIENELYLFEQVHLGIAVSLENGLIVPVIKGAEQLSLNEISKKVVELAEKARKGSLVEEEIQGATFTITNLGQLGVEYFTPILNPPETGILGVGRVVPAPVFIDDKIEKRFLLPLSLTFDHRVIDGAQATEFLNTVCELVNKPQLLLLGSR